MIIARKYVVNQKAGMPRREIFLSGEGTMLEQVEEAERIYDAQMVALGYAVELSIIDTTETEQVQEYAELDPAAFMRKDFGLAIPLAGGSVAGTAGAAVAVMTAAVLGTAMRFAWGLGAKLIGKGAQAGAGAAAKGARKTGGVFTASGKGVPIALATIVATLNRGRVGDLLKVVAPWLAFEGLWEAAQWLVTMTPREVAVYFEGRLLSVMETGLFEEVFANANTQARNRLRARRI